MKITINNLGPINLFEFDLNKDLNLIFGKNNIGKSYAMSAIYLIVKNIINKNWRVNVFVAHLIELIDTKHFKEYEENSALFEEVDRLNKSIIANINKKEEQFDITKNVGKVFEKLIEYNIKEDLEKSFKNSFLSIDALKNEMNDEKFSIRVELKGFCFSIVIINSKLGIDNFKLNKKVIIKQSKINRIIKNSNGFTIHYNKKQKGFEIRLFKNIMNSIIYIWYDETLRYNKDKINNIYFLPASRSGLYNAFNSYASSIAELSKSRNFFEQGLQLPTLSTPVLDYFLHLANIKAEVKDNEYKDILLTLEENILDGKVLFNEQNKKLSFKPNNMSKELDLSFTSSMVSELAPLAAFLKYIIGKNKKALIFIEEPEAHLHPDVQIKITELFAKLADYGIKIIISTHSSYIFGKINNLILEKKIDYKKTGSYLMDMTEKGSVINNNMIAAPDGITDENFVDTAEKLYNERTAIYERLNEDADK
ncbi:MAG: AAA family ATPase [Deltaproteobacteria bacterium]|nr:AAA family ATPase [Deltaproteobacteria bacterium]